MVVLREAYYGETRFEGFVNSLSIARNTLTDRLTLLVEQALLERRLYQSEPARHEYLLTDKGRDFFGVLAALNSWGDRWLSTEDGPPVSITHEPCGHELDVSVTCSHCHEVVRFGSVTVEPGPGYPPRLAAHPAVLERFARASDVAT